MGNQVVNGGLIDFQDNLQRGVQEYITPNQLMAAGYSIPPGSMMMQPGPNSAPLQAGMMPAGQQPAPSYISGPPTFLHVNGITYRPVENPATMQAVNDTKQADPIVDPRRVADSAASAPAVKTLSETDLHRHIDERVSSYMRKQSQGARPPVAAACSTHHGKNKKHQLTDEQRALERVQSVNANMRGRGNTWQSPLDKW